MPYPSWRQTDVLRLAGVSLKCATTTGEFTFLIVLHNIGSLTTASQVTAPEIIAPENQRKHHANLRQNSHRQDHHLGGRAQRFHRERQGQDPGNLFLYFLLRVVNS